MKKVSVYSGVWGELNLSDLSKIKKSELRRELISLLSLYESLGDKYYRVPRAVRWVVEKLPRGEYRSRIRRTYDKN